MGLFTSDRGIIAKNLRLMSSNAKCSMQARINRESLSGNAGTEMINYVEYPCVAANFYYDGKTGEILCFTNYDPEFESYAKGTFRIALDFRKGSSGEYSKIVQTFFDKNASRNANKVIEQSANVYNSIHTGLLK